MSKHTPGPWSANGIYIHAPNGDRIAYMASRDSQALEDARLIAAAPSPFLNKEATGLNSLILV